MRRRQCDVAIRKVIEMPPGLVKFPESMRTGMEFIESDQYMPEKGTFNAIPESELSGCLRKTVTYVFVNKADKNIDVQLWASFHKNFAVEVQVGNQVRIRPDEADKIITANDFLYYRLKARWMGTGTVLIGFMQAWGKAQ